MIPFTPDETLATYVALKEYIRYLDDFINDPETTPEDRQDVQNALKISKSALRKVESDIDFSEIRVE